jgi:hypothetical protein
MSRSRHAPKPARSDVLRCLGPGGWSNQDTGYFTSAGIGTRPA